MSILQTLSQFSEQDAVALSVKRLMQYKLAHKLIPLSPKRTPQAKLAGSYISKMKGRGMEFDEARHYQPGDDIRAIDWRVTARTGKTHTKIFREERERPVFIAIDISATMQFGTQLQLKSVLAGHLASVLAWSAKARGDRVGGLAFNSLAHREIKPKNQDRAILHLLTAISELQQSQPLHIDSAENPLLNATKRLRRLAKPGSLVCIISDFQHLNDEVKQHLRQLTQHCEVRIFGVTDPLETAQQDSSIPILVTDGNEQALRTMKSASQGARYIDIQMSLAKMGMNQQWLCASIPLVTQLTKGLKPLTMSQIQTNLQAAQSVGKK